MMVYVVEFGAYSDRYVSGVYSTEENAKIAAGDSGDVTEFKIDPGIAEHRAGLFGFYIEMHKDGSVLKTDECGHLTNAPHFSFGVSYNLGTFPPRGEPWVYDRLKAIVWARDKQHAIKITNEHRAEKIATGEWQRYEDEVNAEAARASIGSVIEHRKSEQQMNGDR